MQKAIFDVYWSENAVGHYQGIKTYLLDNFSEKEVSKLNSLLKKFETAVSLFPEMYPASQQKKHIHRAVLNKYLSVFYRIEKNEIQLLALFDNRQSISDKEF